MPSVSLKGVQRGNTMANNQAQWLPSHRNGELRMQSSSSLQGTKDGGIEVVKIGSRMIETYKSKQAKFPFNRMERRLKPRLPEVRCYRYSRWHGFLSRINPNTVGFVQEAMEENWLLLLVTDHKFLIRRRFVMGAATGFIAIRAT